MSSLRMFTARALCGGRYFDFYRNTTCLTCGTLWTYRQLFEMFDRSTWEKVPLLDEDKCDGYSVLPEVQKLLKLAHSDDPDKQLEAVIGISNMIERSWRVDASSSGPLFHTLSQLATSDRHDVVTYASRGIKLLVLDDTLRSQATVAGIPSVLALVLREWEDDAVCLREVLGALQTLCFDKATIVAVLSAGVLGPVLKLLDSRELELRILATATVTNMLSFSDSLLLANKDCIDAFSDSMESLLGAIKCGDGLIRDHGLAALANACAHPVLAGRAKELGADKLLRRSLERSVDLFNSPSQMAQTAFARLYAVGHGIGDVEEGGTAEYARLRFYRFKWGVRPSHTAFWSRWNKSSVVNKILMWVILGCMVGHFLGVI